MLNTAEFKTMLKEMEDFESKREKTISLSREVITISKRVIYAIHREDLKEAEALVSQIKKKALSLDIKSYDTDINKVALQEYVEAMCLYSFVKTGNLESKKNLKVNAETYLSGLADLTGEASRLAVNNVIRNKPESIEKIRTLVNDIYGEFLKLNLRNSSLRRKSDSIKHNLKRIDEVLYDIKLRKNENK